MNQVVEHQEKFAKGEVSYQIGINQFADQRADEVPTGKRPLKNP